MNKTERPNQKIKVTGEVIGYQFARTTMGQREFTRKVSNVHETGQLDYHDRPILEGTAVVKDRIVKVRSWITFSDGEVLVWEAVEHLGWNS